MTAAHDCLDASVRIAERQTETGNRPHVSEPVARPYAQLLFTSIPPPLQKPKGIGLSRVSRMGHSR